MGAGLAGAARRPTPAGTTRECGDPSCDVARCVGPRHEAEGRVERDAFGEVHLVSADGRSRRDRELLVGCRHVWIVVHRALEHGEVDHGSVTATARESSAQFFECFRGISTTPAHVAQCGDGAPGHSPP